VKKKQHKGRICSNCDYLIGATEVCPNCGQPLYLLPLNPTPAQRWYFNKQGKQRKEGRKYYYKRLSTVSLRHSKGQVV
jgi:hypothetical protein